MLLLSCQGLLAMYHAAALCSFWTQKRMLSNQRMKKKGRQTATAVCADPGNCSSRPLLPTPLLPLPALLPSLLPSS
jgi:hypothetical protein